MKLNERMKKVFSILLCLCVLVQNCPVVALAAEADELCAHPSYSTESVPETCTVQGYDIHSCTACDYYYIEYHSYSEWSAERPTGIDDPLIQTAKQYRSADKDVKISGESAMDGYTLVETTWNSGSQETNEYASFEGTGFDTTNALYEQYSHPVSAFEDETGKIVLDSEAKTGYLYYHWCYTDSYYAVEASSGSYTTFHAYYDTTSPDTYTCDTTDMSYKTSHSSCSDSAWWFVLDVNTQNYTVYDRVNVFQKLGDWSAWDFAEIQPSETREVETREVYRYANGTPSHDFGTDGICTVCEAVCSHTGGTATCTTLAVCDTCGASYGELGGHTPAENATYTNNGDGTHSFICSVCNETASEAHTMDSATGNCACGAAVAGAKCVNGDSTTYYLTLPEALAVGGDVYALADYEPGFTVPVNVNFYGGEHIFSGEVYNNGVIKSGTFNGGVTNQNLIEGGIFDCWLVNNGFIRNFSEDAFTLGAFFSIDNSVEGGIACSYHHRMNGVCRLCGDECIHTGGEATCIEQAVCTICGVSYGELDANNHTGTAAYTLVDSTKHDAKWSCCNATVTEDHALTYTANGNVITYGCPKCEHEAGTATIIAADKTYDGTLATASVLEAGDLIDETFDIVYTVKDVDGRRVDPVNAGTYTASITYNNVTASVNFTIAKAKLTVTAGDRSITYGDEPADGDVEYSGFVNNETASVLGGSLEYSYNYTKGDNAGRYTITPGGLTSDNYDITFVSGTLTVEKAPPAYTGPSANMLTYNGEAQELVTAGSTNDGELQYSLDGASYSTAIPKATDAGSYTVYYKVVGDENYNDYTAADPITVTIQKATASDRMKAATGNLLSHGTSKVTLPALPEGAAYGDPTTESAEEIIANLALKDGVLTITGGDNVAEYESYTVTVPVTGAMNYGDYAIAVTLTGIVHQHNWSFTGNGDTITATCSGTIGTCPDPEQSFTLTAPDSYTYTGDATYSASVEGSIEGVTYTVNYTGTNTGYSDAEAPVNADTYTVTLTAGDKSVSDTFTISPKDISKVASCQFSLTQTSFVYSGKAPVLNVTGVDSSVGSYTMQEGIDYTVGTVQVNAGSHKLTVTGKGNYTGTVELDYTITAKEVSITGAKIQPVTYNSSGYTLTVTGVTFDGVVDGETLTYTAEATLGNTNAVGEQDATVSVTLNNSNYTLKDVTYQTKVTINKAAATVATAPTAIEDLVYTGNSQDLISVSEVQVEGGELVLSWDGNIYSRNLPSETNVGTYYVWYKVQGDDNHYDSEPVKLTITIGKAPLTVTAKDNSITYGEAPSANGIVYSGFVNGETEAVLGGTVAYSFSYEQYGNVGSYKITPAGLTSDNYEITFADGTLTVNAKVITVTAEAKSKTYGEADPALTYKVEGLVNGDEVTGDLKRVAGENVGSYAIEQNTLTAGNNYRLTYTCAELIIKPKTIADSDVELNGSLTYTGEEQTQEITVTEGIVYEVTGNKATEVGDYTLTVTASGNYTGSVTRQWSIGKAAAVFAEAPTANVLTYTGEAQNLISGGTSNDGKIVYSLTEDGKYSETIPTGTDAGEYTVWYYVVGDSSHLDSEKASVDVTIARKELTAVVSGSVTKSYDGTNMIPTGHSLNIMLNGVISGEMVSASADFAFAGIDVGTKTVNATNIALSGSDAANYKLQNTTASADAGQIIPLDINNLEPHDYSIVFGAEPVYNGKEQTMTVENFVMCGMDVTYELTGNVGTEAGVYTLTVTATGNFAGTITENWKIYKKPVTVTAKDQTITYADAISAGEFTSTGLADGHSANVTLTPSTANVTVDGTITASAAVITADGTDVTANYEISYAEGKLVIKPDISAIENLNTENITSANKADIKAVQEMLENADSSKEEWTAIAENCQDMIERLEAVEEENQRIAETASQLDLKTVKSSDEAAIGQLISDIDDQIATGNLTDEEKTELESLKTKCENLIARIDGTEALIGQLEEKLADLDEESVKSTDKAVLEQIVSDAQTLIDSGNITDGEEEALKQTQKDAKELIQVIEDTAGENKTLAEKAETFDENTVNSADQAKLEQLARNIEALLETQNLTGKERADLEAVLEQVEDMIDTVENTAVNSKLATDAVAALDLTTVTSADKAKLQQTIAKLDNLLADDHLTQEERKTLEKAKTDAEALLDVIERAQDAADTENTEKAENVTSGNVKPEDKEVLEDAAADLEKALENNTGNYTEAEKQAIRNEIQRIEKAIEALENVEDVTDAVTRLPETVKPDNEAAAEEILAAKEAYDALTDHEKSLVEKTAKEKLDNLLSALTAYDIIKGDGGKWTKGGNSGLSFTANGPLSKFVGIKVDGKTVDEQYYEAKSGSTIITLKQSFLKKLSADEHTLTVVYTDGETSGTFRIQPEATTPPTGDFQIIFWTSTMVVSFVALALLLIKLKRRTGK